MYEIGFEVKKNEYNRFYIDTEKPNNLSFTPEEGDFLRNLILSAASDHNLTDALLMKIQQSKKPLPCLFQGRSKSLQIFQALF